MTDKEILQKHLTIQDFFKISNLEDSRAVLKEIGGLNELLKHSKNEYIVLDSSDEHEYKLLEFKTPDGNIKALHMKNPSTGEIHVETVHPDCKTVSDALYFANEDIFAILNSKEYFKPKMLT